jgi:ABC-2 type transport system ATP-binding protein
MSAHPATAITSTTTSIVVDGVSKTFRYQAHPTLKKVLQTRLRGQRTSETFKALDEVSFEVQQGESIGLMGLNGSGKSTLLKLVSGVMRPDEGQVLTRGRISGLIATGAGFHNELTGRDNIYMNAAMLGMTKEETDAKFDDIAAFADVGRFLDTPVGNYSSGMFARLGFSVAVHVDCDIFIADEVLAVGDRPFKRKCLKRMKQIRESGITMFYVSHSAGSVKRMCDRAIVLEKGRVGFDGDVDEAIAFLHYDGDEEEPDAEDSSEDERDEALASDI